MSRDDTTSLDNQEIFLEGDDIPLIDIDQGFSTTFTGFGSLDPLIKPDEFHAIKRSASQPIPVVKISNNEADAPFAQLPMVKSLMDISSIENDQSNDQTQIIRRWKM
ncbi:hypothetical protein GPJ56_005687 [Histomonas meleagridis]|uniref:uncharacterized protein n=1 Tax=Histomonas meleagridis TaxID=135588 RepID=UPI00355A72EC|nr:hypothetical protein GPJ56_005687 [Histomonas meleagridis]KAH0803378.1 hypothetical protein GO595_003722 [Histomonas meleagridis]